MKKNIKTILLTGATGFLGSKLCSAFLEAGYSVVALKRSFSDISLIRDIIDRVVTYDIDKDSIPDIFADNVIDVIVHASTLYGRKHESSSDIVRANVLFPLELLELGAKHGLSGFINTDTFTEFNERLEGLYEYALSKSQLKKWLKKYSSATTIINLRLEHVYGEHDSDSKFIPWIIKSLLSCRPEIKMTAGEQKRDFIYVGDVVQIYLKVLNIMGELGKKYYSCDVGTGTATSIKSVTTLLKRLAGSSSDLIWGAIPYRRGETHESKADLKRLYGMIGDFHSTDIEEGFMRTVEWYRKHRS